MSPAWRQCMLAVIVLAIALPAPVAAAANSEPTVVVAVADTGVNPYHEVYYRPENTTHPCEWVAGFDDCGIPALALSVGMYATYEEAVAADQALWASVQPNTWYWIPKTNIIGAVCDGSSALSPTGMLEAPSNVCILDDQGHGTSSTSSVLSEAPDSLLLVHDGNSTASALATAPVTPDIQSHSWGNPAAVPMHVADPAIPGEPSRCGDGAFDDETIFFISAGNETPTPAVADCTAVNNRVQTVGGGYPGYWQSNSRTMYDFASWYCRPTASSDSITDIDPSHCGTSFAAPTAAGAAAAALLSIRQQEGYASRSTPEMVSTTVSRTAFIGAMRNAATYTPTSKFSNKGGAAALPLPAQAPWLFWGYGWLDSTVTDAIVACALGGACPPKSDQAEEHMALRRSVRSATSDDAIPARPQDDAGSGRDAGASADSAVPIVPGSYRGRLEPSPALAADVFGGDKADWFAFTAEAGQTIGVNFTGGLGHWALFDPNGNELGGGYTYGGIPNAGEVGAVTSGTYWLAYDTVLLPHEYEFTLAVPYSQLVRAKR